MKRKSRSTKTGIPHLTRDAVGFRYYHRIKKTWIRLGSDFSNAATIAEQANAAIEQELFRQQQQKLDAVIRGETANSLVTIDRLIDRYIEHRVPEKNWSAQTTKNMQWLMGDVRHQFGKRIASTITTKDIADFMRGKTPNAQQKYKAFLRDLFRFAISEGEINTNPVDNVLIKKAPPRQRGRLSLDAFMKIRDAAPDYLRVAMELCLYTMLRPSDLVRLEFAGIRDSRLYTDVAKTQNYNDPIYLSIAITPAIQQTLERAMGSGVDSPLIIHKEPRRIDTRKKEHKTAVSTKTLSREFTRIRDELGLYDDKPRAQRPTFYEIRSLSASLAKKYAELVDIQTLMGHTDAKMTKHYQAGHEIEYTQVAPLLPDNLL